MRLIYLLTTTLCLGTQSVPSAKFDDTQYRKALGLDSHIHMPGNCKGAPDGVYMRSGQSYDACISGRNVCNRDPAEIPDRLMRANGTPSDAGSHGQGGLFRRLWTHSCRRTLARRS